MEVSCKPVIDLVNYFEKKGLDPAPILAGSTPEDSISPQSIANGENRIPWVQLSAAFDRALQTLNSQNQINEFVDYLVSRNSSIMQDFQKILNAVPSCKLLYQLLISVIAVRLFPGAEIKYDFSGNQLLVSTRLPEGDLPSKSVFLIIKTVLERAPTIIGMAPARINAEMSGVSSSYRIELPADLNIFSRLWRYLRTILNANQIIKDIASVEIDLQKSQAALISENLSLKQQVKIQSEEIENIKNNLCTKIKEVEKIESISGTGTWTINNATKEVHLSASAAKILGLASRALQTTHDKLVECIHPEDRKEYLIAFSRLTVKSPSFTLEHRIIEGEKTRILQQKGKLFVDGDSHTTIGSVFDVTNLRENEIRLEKEREIAIEASHNKSQFLASMSHEIRTPMTSVLGFAELITNPKTNPENTASYVETILRNGRNLLALIDDILDLSKVEVGYLRFNIANHLTRDIVRSSIEKLAALKSDISFDLEFHPEVPETIQTDIVRFNQIIHNILSNALKFAVRGVFKVEVRPSLSSSNTPGIELLIEDISKGISPEFNRLLISPYSAFEMDKRKGKTGVGLELALARALAKAMEGSIQLNSPVDQMGSDFSITIHALKDGPAALTPFQSLDNYSIPIDFLSSGPLLKNRKILIAEDNKDIQEILVKLVSDAGASTEIANNGVECLEKNDATPFDMILMDLQMPVMDGFETIERLRAGGFKKPIIVVTAYALNNERERCIKAGCTDFISKPINGEALLKTLARHRNL